jgi:diguanylate cyclase (GGDEF)-like protein
VAVLLAAEEAIVLDGSDRLLVSGTAAGIAVLLAALGLFVGRRPVPASWGHPLTAAALVALSGHAVLRMVLTGQPRQSTTLILAAACAGLVLVSLRWVVAVLYLVWGGWTVGALLIGPSETWVHFAIGLALATALALVVSGLRRRAAGDLVEARRALDAAAVRDHLTGLANRRGLAMVGAQIVEQARRQGDAVHCIFVDIDGLKHVNERAGHECGDEVIVAVGEAVRHVTRATDVVARWAGDEFCVVGPGPGMAPLEMERRVRDMVALHLPVPPDVWPVRVSAGGAMLAPWDSGTLETLLGKADQEMHLRRSLRRERSPLAPRRASAD